jgi:glyoxylase-like metal-dependent hydrolase (beta-lactamase superfamily II)
VTVTEAAPDVFLAKGTDVNWVLLREGTDLTLIDTGYPGDLDRVTASIAEIGRRPEDVRAVLLTHAHVDHLGAANHFADRYGVPVYTDATEARHARREFLEQASRLDVAKNLWRPGVAPWLGRVMRVGVTKDVRIPTAQAFPAQGPLDLPGRPVPVPTRGHTSGHTAYFLPAAGAVATGDELVTWHAVTRHRGPHVLPAFFGHGDTAKAVDVLAGVAADVILPGHGDALRQPIADAVAEARRRLPARNG